QKPNCNTLKFYGPAYKVRDILKLLPAEFNFLIANAADFIYREDINKAVYGEFNPKDNDLFKEFLKYSSAFADLK
ncbi:uncharacterized protein K441DRAFT_542511, partial [Cenococcum geophilum 1.58]|uniref:uncharacterized protein n=1 Tax=Cenococcum geophilum 1.58 TaxID=794803 RepID=UPI0035901631